MANPLDEDIVIVPLGAGREVGRSCILLYIGGKCIMLDCGMHMGYTDVRRYPDFAQLTNYNKHGVLNPSGQYQSHHASLMAHYTDYTSHVDCLLISHYHLDHTGALPFFHRIGYRGPIVMSTPTLTVCQTLLEDFHQICFAEVDTNQGSIPTKQQQQNQKHPQSQLPQEKSEDYFSAQDVYNCLNSPHLQTARLHETIYLDGMSFTPHYAGHVIGAVMWEIRVGRRCVLYTGDYNMTSDAHLASATIPQGLLPDVVISEATYAGTVREGRRYREQQIIQQITNTVRNGGKVLIPVFAMGRAQELCMVLHREWERVGFAGVVPLCMAGNIANIGTTHYRMYNEWAKGECSSVDVYPIHPSVFQRDPIVHASCKEESEMDVEPRVGYTESLLSLANPQFNTLLLPPHVRSGGGMSTGYQRTSFQSPLGCDLRPSVSMNPFIFPYLTPFTNAIISRPDPCVLLASPGMLHTGLSLYALSQWADDPRNLLIFPGYCSPNSIGGQILAGEKQVKVEQLKLLMASPGSAMELKQLRQEAKQKGTTLEKMFSKRTTTIDIRLSIAKISMSAHSDAHGILSLTRTSQTPVLILVHGNSPSIDVLSSYIAGQLGIYAASPYNFIGVRVRKDRIIGPGWCAQHDPLVIFPAVNQTTTITTSADMEIDGPDSLLPVNSPVIPSTLFDDDSVQRSTLGHRQSIIYAKAHQPSQLPSSAVKPPQHDHLLSTLPFPTTKVFTSQRIQRPELPMRHASVPFPGIRPHGRIAVHPQLYSYIQHLLMPRLVHVRRSRSSVIPLMVPHQHQRHSSTPFHLSATPSRTGGIAGGHASVKRMYSTSQNIDVLVITPVDPTAVHHQDDQGGNDTTTTPFRPSNGNSNPPPQHGKSAGANTGAQNPSIPSTTATGNAPSPACLAQCFLTLPGSIPTTYDMSYTSPIKFTLSAEQMIGLLAPDELDVLTEYVVYHVQQCVASEQQRQQQQQQQQQRQSNDIGRQMEQYIKHIPPISLSKTMLRHPFAVIPDGSNELRSMSDANDTHQHHHVASPNQTRNKMRGEVTSSLIRLLSLSISSQLRAVWHNLHDTPVPHPTAKAAPSLLADGEEGVFLCGTSFTVTTKGLWPALSQALCWAIQHRTAAAATTPTALANAMHETPPSIHPPTVSLSVILNWKYSDDLIAEQLETIILQEQQHLAQPTL